MKTPVGVRIILGALLFVLLPTAARAETWTGRYVRLERRGILNIAEVEAYSGGINVARGKPATQSSVMCGGVPARAVDGVRLGAWTAGSVIHTADGKDAPEWWEVDLGAAMPIEGVAIWGRTDLSSLDRMVGVTVKILDAARKTAWETTLDAPRKRFFFGQVPPPVEATYPTVTLKNEAIELVAYLPDPEKGYYRSTRFDWSSALDRAVVNGRIWFGNWRDDPHTPTLIPDDIRGPAGEFGSGSLDTSLPPGFAEAAPGETFLKIGVGELRKPANDPPDRKYSFNGSYALVHAFPWTVKQGDDWIEYEQESTNLRGYQYRLTRRISLTRTPPGFVMDCRLENRGEKPIDQGYYEHNFVGMNGDGVGPAWRVVYPFAPSLSPTEKPKTLFALRGRSVVFPKPLTCMEADGMRLEGFGATPADNQAILIRDDWKAALKITSDQPPLRVYLYAMPKVVCPEMYIRVYAPPGGEARWRTTYAWIDAPAMENDQ